MDGGSGAETGLPDPDVLSELLQAAKKTPSRWAYKKKFIRIFIDVLWFIYKNKVSPHFKLLNVIYDV